MPSGSGVPRAARATTIMRFRIVKFDSISHTPPTGVIPAVRASQCLTTFRMPCRFKMRSRPFRRSRTRAVRMAATATIPPSADAFALRLADSSAGRVALHLAALLRSRRNVRWHWACIRRELHSVFNSAL